MRKGVLDKVRPSIVSDLGTMGDAFIPMEIPSGKVFKCHSAKERKQQNKQNECT